MATNDYRLYPGPLEWRESGNSYQDQLAKRQRAIEVEEYTRRMMGPAAAHKKMTRTQVINRAWDDRHSWLQKWFESSKPYWVVVVAQNQDFRHGAPDQPAYSTGPVVRLGEAMCATEREEVVFELRVVPEPNVDCYEIIVRDHRISGKVDPLVMHKGPLIECPLYRTNQAGYYAGDPEPKREAGMNYTTAIFLVNTDVRCVGVSYEPNAVDPTKPGVQVPFKTMNKDLGVGDLVVVPTDTRHRFTVAKVEAVDIDVDFDAGFQMKWVVDPVNQAGYDSVLTQEAKAIEIMKSAEKRAKRDELGAKIMADNPDLQALGIVNANPSLAAPPVPEKDT